jgi:hypothetical protein
MQLFRNEPVTKNALIFFMLYLAAPSVEMTGAPPPRLTFMVVVKEKSFTLPSSVFIACELHQGLGNVTVGHAAVLHVVQRCFRAACATRRYLDHLAHTCVHETKSRRRAFETPATGAVLGMNLGGAHDSGQLVERNGAGKVPSPFPQSSSRVTDTPLTFWMYDSHGGGRPSIGKRFPSRPVLSVDGRREAAVAKGGNFVSRKENLFGVSLFRRLGTGSPYFLWRRFSRRNIRSCCLYPIENKYQRDWKCES